ncbi:MAG: TrkA C-terminal domain-containing protein [Kineosporiaceae bacterium]
MHAVFEYLKDEPLLVLFFLIGIGAALGHVRVFGVQIGPAAVLFASIAFTATANHWGVDIKVSKEVGELGLALFTYTIGMMAGPGFFSVLKTGWRIMLAMSGALIAAAGVAWGLGSALGLNRHVIAGTFAGGLTNTPALAAATERITDPAQAAQPTIGYSIAYLFGVVGMLIAASIALGRKGDDDGAAAGLTNVTVRVERTDHPRLREIEAAYGNKLTFSRVRHGETSPVLVADHEDRLEVGDLVTVVGPREVVDKVAAELGHASSHKLTADRRELDFRRITLSKGDLAGRTLGSLDLFGKFGATVTRVRRGDVDMIAAEDLVLQPGDRLRVIAPHGKMKEVSKHLGDSVRGLSDINPVGLGLGMALGVALGSIKFNLPGGGFELGAAAGTLILGLILGRVGRVGPLVLTLPHTAATALSHIGMLAFLAYAGTKAGGQFVKAVSSDLGWKIAVVGAVVTLTSVAIQLFIVQPLFKVGGMRMAGVLAGSQTQPAVLAYANDRTGFDQRVALGYALVYPVAMVVKILLAQILVGS